MTRGNSNRVVAEILEVLTAVVRNHSRRSESRLVRCFHPEPDRETETGCIRKINGPCGNQADFLERQRFGQIDLHPLDRVWIGLDAAVVPVAWAFFILGKSRAQLFVQSLQLAVKLRDFGTGNSRDPVRELTIKFLDRLLFPGQQPALNVKLLI